jgi:hypothetical protein
MTTKTGNIMGWPQTRLDRVRAALAAGALMLFTAAPAGAAIVFQDNFDSEPHANSILNYGTAPSPGFTNWDVIGGNTDLIRNTEFNISCHNNSFFCIDMDGTGSQAGQLRSKTTFAAGSYVLSFAISGNQRRPPIGSTTPDSMTVIFGNLTETFTLDFDAPFQTVARNVTVGPGGAQILFNHENNEQDQLGLILDDVLLVDAESSSLPGPGTALLFGPAVAGALRLSRRRARAPAQRT